MKKKYTKLSPKMKKVLEKMMSNQPKVSDKPPKKRKYPKTIKKIEKLSARPFGLTGWNGWEDEIEKAIDEDLK